MKLLVWRSLSEAWLVLVLAAVFGASLAAVHAGLGARIEANKRAETMRQVPALLGIGGPPDGGVQIIGDRLRVTTEPGSSLELSVEEGEVAGHRVFEVSDRATGELVGWVVYGAGQGYADTIELLLGVSSDASVMTGLFVLSQKETPALGDGITRMAFRERFTGRPTDRPLAVTRDPGSSGGILALTAATISSQSVCDIVNRTLSDVRRTLEAREVWEE